MTDEELERALIERVQKLGLGDFGETEALGASAAFFWPAGTAPSAPNQRHGRLNCPVE
jgi:hypothetical protein